MIQPSDVTILKFRKGKLNKQIYVSMTYNCRRLRSSVLQHGCHYGLQECLTKGKELFNGWVTDFQRTGENKLV